MAIINDLTYEQALEYPEPKEILVDESGIYVLTEEDMTHRSNLVPQEVEAYQAKLALLEAGLLQDAIDYTNTSENEELKIRFEGGKFRRDSAYIAAYAASRGLSEAQIDELFIRAAHK